MLGQTPSQHLAVVAARFREEADDQRDARAVDVVDRAEVELDDRCAEVGSPGRGLGQRGIAIAVDPAPERDPGTFSVAGDRCLKRTRVHRRLL